QHDHCAGALLHRRLEKLWNAAARPYVERPGLDAERLCRTLGFRYRMRISRLGRVREDGHARESRHYELQQLDLLGAYFRREDRQARDVAAGPRKAGSELGAYGVGIERHDDGDR